MIEAFRYYSVGARNKSQESFLEIHNHLTDYLSFNKKRLEWSKTYLKQHGLSSIEITAILESQEDIEHR